MLFLADITSGACLNRQPDHFYLSKSRSSLSLSPYVMQLCVYVTVMLFSLDLGLKKNSLLLLVSSKSSPHIKALKKISPRLSNCLHLYKILCLVGTVHFFLNALVSFANWKWKTLSKQNMNSEFNMPWLILIFDFKLFSNVFVACCIFWPAFGCSAIQTLVKISFLNVFHAEKLKKGKKWPH